MENNNNPKYDNEPIYKGKELSPVDIKARAPLDVYSNILKERYVEKYEKENPFVPYRNDYLKKFKPERYEQINKTRKNIWETQKNEYLNKPETKKSMEYELKLREQQDKILAETGELVSESDLMKRVSPTMEGGRTDKAGLLDDPIFGAIALAKVPMDIGINQMMGAFGKTKTGKALSFIGEMLNPVIGTKGIGVKQIDNVLAKEMNTIKEGSKILNKTDDVIDITKQIGTPLNRPFDIHDVRKKYHNSLILQPEEIKLLNKEGPGIKSNYKNISGDDIVGKMNIEDVKVKETDYNRNSIEELLFGKDYSNQKVSSKTNNKTSLNDFKPNKSNFEVNELNIKSKKTEIEDFIKELQTDISPFERTETSIKADKWLTEWFTHPETKKAFINYGGTESEWTVVLNSLENPIRSSTKWGKNQPGGAYMKIFDQASIPTDASVDVGVHEGIHKTKLLLSKNNPILNNLWNDFTDAVREIPVESYPEIFRLRYNMGLKPGQKIDMNVLEEGLKTIEDGYSIPNKIKDKTKLLEIINKAPALIPFLAMESLTQNQINQKNNEKEYEYRSGGGGISNIE
jgi:hypothetical protein